MEKYLNKLMEQFISARGIKNPDVNSSEFINDFSEWIRESKLISGYYVSFLDYLNGRAFTSDSVEIGKGKYDSLAACSDSLIVTPYTDGLEDSERIIKGEFSARGFGNGPVILTKGKLQLVDPSINRFMTHNPYTASDIRNWERIHNNGNNITVGVYGSIYDKDINEKLKQMKQLKDKLQDDSYNEEKACVDYGYYYAISSDRKTLKKVLYR